MGRAIIVHGGAGLISTERYGAARDGCRVAADAGWRVLLEGGSALDAVQAAVMALEDNPGFNAGTGAVLTDDGRAQLDAGIMEGETLAVGAVAGVERIKNPIALARAVLSSPHVLLLTTGAEQFAQESGMRLCDPSELVTEAQRARWQRGYQEGDDVNTGIQGVDASTLNIHTDDTQHGTVGAVAVDSAGHIAAATSTGGIAAKHPGRVGDAPLPGCGYYAEVGLGGVSSTGHGEDFTRLLLAKRAVDFLGQGLTAQQAAEAAIRLLGERLQGSGGLILLDSTGNVGYAHNTPSMARAYITDGMTEPEASV